MRGDVANVRAAVDTAKHFFRERAEGVTDRAALEADRAATSGSALVSAEVPVRSAHAAEALGLMGPGDGVAVAYSTDTWTRLCGAGRQRRHPPWPASHRSRSSRCS